MELLPCAVRNMEMMHVSQLSCELLEVRNWLSCSSLDPGTDPPPDGTGSKREDDIKQRVHGLCYRCVMSVRAGIWRRIWSLNLENLECHSQKGHFYPLSIRSITEPVSTSKGASFSPCLGMCCSLRVEHSSPPFSLDNSSLSSHRLKGATPSPGGPAHPSPGPAPPLPSDHRRLSLLASH